MLSSAPAGLGRSDVCYSQESTPRPPWRRLDQWAAQESVRGGCPHAARAASLLFDAIAASSGKWTSGGTERE